MSFFQTLMFAMTLFFAYQIYRHVRQLEDALPQNEIQPEHNISFALRLVEQADESYKTGDLLQAKTYLEDAYLHDRKNPEVLNKYAFVVAKTGDRLKAIELYEESLELDENDDLTHNAIASLYRAENAYERSQDHYLKAIAIDDSYAQTFYNYGNLLVDMHQAEEARSMYKHALELQSDFPQAREALISLGDIK
ncbi:MAG: hypothetical protein PHO27_03305 [Sulfuricurvum sp.]|nr:hypothetical protein [Sulfuricurvum sp.]